MQRLAPIALVVCVAAVGCDDGGREPCSSETAPFTLTSHRYDGLQLTVDVSYTGGCEAHEFEVRWNGLVADSLPPQIELELHHFANGDSCEAVIDDQLTIDLVPVDGAFAEGVVWLQVNDGGPRTRTFYRRPTTSGPTTGGLPITTDCSEFL